MGGPINTTRGAAFDPGVARAQREQAVLIARELEQQRIQEEKRLAREAREKHKEEMRAYGRRLDEEARKTKRRKKRDEIDQCYREREKA